MIKIEKTLSVDSFFSGFEATYNSKFILPGECNNYWEFLYVSDGFLEVFSGDKTFELSSGKLIFFPPLAFHSIRSAKGSCPHVIVMTFSLSQEEFPALTDGFFNISSKEKEIILRGLSAYEEGVRYAFPIKNQIAALKIEELILTLLENQIPQKEEINRVGTANYKTILKVISANIEEKLTMEEIAKKCGLSVSNLKKTFYKYAGISIMKYYNTQRMKKAIEFMSDGKNMNEISELLNFSSQHYFTTAFKNEYGISPLSYKKQILKKD